MNIENEVKVMVETNNRLQLGATESRAIIFIFDRGRCYHVITDHQSSQTANLIRFPNFLTFWRRVSFTSHSQFDRKDQSLLTSIISLFTVHNPLTVTAINQISSKVLETMVVAVKSPAKPVSHKSQSRVSGQKASQRNVAPTLPEVDLPPAREGEYDVIIPTLPSGELPFGVKETANGKAAFSGKSALKHCAMIIRNEGDVIMAVNGVSTKGLKVDEVKKLIKKHSSAQPFAYFRFRIPSNEASANQPPMEVRKKSLQDEISSLADKFKNTKKKIEHVQEEAAKKIIELQNQMVNMSDLMKKKEAELQTVEQEEIKWMEQKLREMKKTQVMKNLKSSELAEELQQAVSEDATLELTMVGSSDVSEITTSADSIGEFIAADEEYSSVNEENTNGKSETHKNDSVFVPKSCHSLRNDLETASSTISDSEVSEQDSAASPSSPPEDPILASEEEGATDIVCQ